MSLKKIIITRPEPFASQLAEALKAAGFDNIICLPCVMIENLKKIPPAPPLQKGVPSASEAGDFSPEHLTINDKIDILIFVSRNAVIHGHSLINTEEIAAIGLGTKSELERYGHAVDIFLTQAPFNSEALLALPEFSNVQHTKIAIIRGGEGRELLCDALTARGAQVHYIDVYTRTLPHYTDQLLQEVFNNPSQSLVICTSEELLKNLCVLLKKAKIDLSRLQLCVISAKMADTALMAGFIKPAIIANSPRDEDIVWKIQSSNALH